MVQKWVINEEKESERKGRDRETERERDRETERQRQRDKKRERELVCLSFYLSNYLSIYTPYIYLSIYLSRCNLFLSSVIKVWSLNNQIFYLFFLSSFCLSIFGFVCLSMYVQAIFFLFLYCYLSIYPSIHVRAIFF